MQNTCRLFPFYKAVGGNWRNAIYISCTCSQCPYTASGLCGGYLLSANSDGVPMIVSARQYGAVTGEIVEPSECRGQITRQAFEAAYAQYILWQLSETGHCPLLIFSRQYTCK